MIEQILIFINDNGFIELLIVYKKHIAHSRNTKQTNWLSVAELERYICECEYDRSPYLCLFSKITFK